jgi:hypothetical protein
MYEPPTLSVVVTTPPLPPGCTQCWTRRRPTSPRARALCTVTPLLTPHAPATRTFQTRLLVAGVHLTWARVWLINRRYSHLPPRTPAPHTHFRRGCWLACASITGARGAISIYSPTHTYARTPARVRRLVASVLACNARRAWCVNASPPPHLPHTPAPHAFKRSWLLGASGRAPTITRRARGARSMPYAAQIFYQVRFCDMIRRDSCLVRSIWSPIGLG